MKIVNLFLMAGLACGVGVPAVAQQSVETAGDIKYCNDLAGAYRRMHSMQQAMPASDAVTLSQCGDNPRQTIAVLEKKFRDKQIPLPPDERIARQPAPSARADNPDSAYCSALAKRYSQYLNETIGQGGLPTSLDGRVASERCSGGDIKASIFVLEQKLTNAKLGLPKR